MLSKARYIPNYSASHHKRDAYYVHVCQCLKSSFFSLFLNSLFIETKKQKKDQKKEKKSKNNIN